VTPSLIPACLFLAASACIPSSAEAQDTPQSAARTVSVGAGGHLFSRLPADGLSAGGAVTLGIGAGRTGVALEAGTTRRDGHNDWRALVGPRIWLTDGATTRLYGHALGGAFIRLGNGGVSGAAGLGIEHRISRGAGLRLQGDVIVDRSRGTTSSGARVSVWLVSK
jgi:hypothetical protein